MNVTLNSWQLLGVILASALFWLQYVRVKDRRKPEPRRCLIIAFILGIVAGIISILGFNLLDALGVPDIKFGEKPWTAFYCFMIVGPLEEGMKALVAYQVVFRWREFDEPIDGFVYAAAIALGFASTENFSNLPDFPWLEQLARTAALPITHTLMSAIWGFGAGYARFCVPPGRRRRLWQFGSLALGMAVHGLYDFLIFAYQATFISSGLALVLWGVVIWWAHAALKHPLVATTIPTQLNPSDGGSAEEGGKYSIGNGTDR